MCLHACELDTCMFSIRVYGSTAVCRADVWTAVRGEEAAAG